MSIPKLEFPPFHLPAEAEALRRLPDATVQAAVDAELFAMVVPPSLGGLGLGLDTLAQSTRILATGCPASAWTLSFLVMHSWLLARLDPGAHAELFPEPGYALAPAPLNPTGTATPVDGGFRLTGRWEWATGIEHADWVLVHAIVDRPDELATAFLVVPRADAIVEDVWHTTGMRATGSNAVTITDVFVPTHRTIARASLMDGGATLADDPMAGYPVVAVLALVAAAPALSYRAKFCWGTGSSTVSGEPRVTDVRCATEPFTVGGSVPNAVRSQPLP